MVRGRSEASRPSRLLTWLLVLLAANAVTATFWLAGYGPVAAPEALGVVMSLVAAMLLIGWVGDRHIRAARTRMDELLAESHLARQRAENTGVWASRDRSLAIRWDRDARCFRVLGDLPITGVWVRMHDEVVWRNVETLGQVILDAEAAGMVATPDVATSVLRTRVLWPVMYEGWRRAAGRVALGPR